MASTKVGHALQAALIELEAERDRIERAIGELRALVFGMSGARKRGPKPRSASAPRLAVKKTAKAGPKRAKAWTAEKRNAARLRMKKYWEAKRKEASAQHG